MKILYIVPYAPSQIYVRPYQLIRGLAAQGHEVHLASIWTNTDDQTALAELEQAGIQVLSAEQSVAQSLINSALALPGRTPLQAVYSWQPALARQLKEIIKDNGENYEVIHIEHLRGARYGLFIRNLRGESGYQNLASTPIVWDSVDCISHLFRQASKNSRKLSSRIITRLELPRTERFEQTLIRSFDQVLVTSQVDLQALNKNGNTAEWNSPITVLPNGVDLHYFQPAPQLVREPQTLVVTGKMSYHANVTMVLYLMNQIMPMIWEKLPETNVWIVGKDPGQQVQNLQEDPRVTVTGTVPDIRPYLQEATAAVAPIQYGAGIQNKVLQAMACGTPVICTPGATAALQTQAGKDIIVAQSPEQFAQAVVHLLNDPSIQAKIGQAGRDYVEKHHDWTKITKKLEFIYQKAINHRSS